MGSPSAAVGWVAADAVGYGGAIALVTVVTAASALWVALVLASGRRPRHTAALASLQVGGDERRQRAPGQVFCGNYNTEPAS